MSSGTHLNEQKKRRKKEEEGIKEELVLSYKVPDSIVIGGPSNSTIRNGGTSRRGYAPEKGLWLKEGAVKAD